MKYTAPTFADRLYVDILHNADFPIDRYLEEIKNFWSENAVNFGEHKWTVSYMIGSLSHEISETISENEVDMIKSHQDILNDYTNFLTNSTRFGSGGGGSGGGGRGSSPTTGAGRNGMTDWGDGVSGNEGNEPSATTGSGFRTKWDIRVVRRRGG